jgi:hypothetical protein
VFGHGGAYLAGKYVLEMPSNAMLQDISNNTNKSYR